MFIFYDNIFAIGDIVNMGEAKLITIAMYMPRLYATNIERLATNKHNLLDHHPKSTDTVAVHWGRLAGLFSYRSAKTKSFWEHGPQA